MKTIPSGASYSARPKIYTNKMKPTLIILLTLLGIGLFGLMALGEIEINPPIKQSVIIEAVNGEPTVYRELNEWEVRTTVTVPKSECLSCMDYMDVTDCQKYFRICLEVN
jgi:hypothetical protein